MGLEHDLRFMLDDAAYQAGPMRTLQELRQSSRGVKGVRISSAEWDEVARDMLRTVDAQRTAILRLAREIDQLRAARGGGDDVR